MGLVGVGALVVVGAFVAAVWPPRVMPRALRRWTRPLRRRVRPRHYRGY